MEVIQNEIVKEVVKTDEDLVMKIKVKEFKKAYKKMKEMEDKVAALKADLLKDFEGSGLIEFDNVRYVGAFTRESLDTTKMKKVDSKLYNELMKEWGKVSTVSATLKVN